jgi:hypothetical protein
VGRLLVEGLAAASLKGEWSTPALVKLKQKLLEWLRDQPTLGPAGKGKGMQSVVADFVKAQGGMLSRVGGAFKGEPDQAALTTRAAEVEECFPSAEREAYAALAMRRFCPGQACQATSEEHPCEFRPVLCPHSGCNARLSARSQAAHEETCRFKVIACEACGEMICRGEMPKHLASACPERSTDCAFSCVGCAAPLTQRRLPTHLDDCTQSHLLLLLQAFQAERESNKALRARLEELERNTAAQEVERAANLTALAGTVTAIRTHLEGVEKKLAQTAQEAKKADSAAASAQSSLQKDVTGLRADLKKLDSVLKDQGRLSSSSSASVEGKLGPLTERVQRLEAAVQGAAQPAGRR